MARLSIAAFACVSALGLTLLPGCGGKAQVPFPDPPSDGDASSDGALDSPLDSAPSPDATPLQDSSLPPDATTLPDSALPQDSSTSDVWNPFYPACAERGGSCALVDSVDASCPVGTYSPFSGYEAMCPTDSIRLCCAPTGGIGSGCTLENPCNNGGCMPEQSGYPVGGLCTEICGYEGHDCPSWATCLPVLFSQAPGLCLVSCTRDTQCREGWSCQAFPKDMSSSAQTVSSYVCWGRNQMYAARLLGEACERDTDCVSTLCRRVPGSQRQKVCAAACDPTHPCLEGYQCRPSSQCTGDGCGYCFAN